MKYAIVQNQTVINIIEWDGESQFSVPSDVSLIFVPDNTYVDIDSQYINGEFIESQRVNPNL